MTLPVRVTGSIGKPSGSRTAGCWVTVAVGAGEGEAVGDADGEGSGDGVAVETAC